MKQVLIVAGLLLGPADEHDALGGGGRPARQMRRHLQVPPYSRPSYQSVIIRARSCIRISHVAR